MHEIFFTFITSNREKVASAQIYLDPENIIFETQSIKIVEIQSDSIEEISTHKAKQAFDVLKKPVVVSDHGWFFRSLNGFPGAYMKQVNDWLSPEDLLNLLEPYTDRSVTKREVLCFYDGNRLKHFVQDLEGTVLEYPIGSGTSAMQIVSLSKSGLSVGQCIERGIDPTDGAHHLWKDLAFWLKSDSSLLHTNAQQLA